MSETNTEAQVVNETPNPVAETATKSDNGSGPEGIQGTQGVNGPQFPPVRSYPVWDANSLITLTGREFEIVYNAVNQIVGAYQALQGILSRNILDGVISMDFEKDADGGGNYVPMSDEEKAPHLQEFAKAIESVKNARAAASAPKPTIVDPNTTA